jgi:RNA polymerase primary sigma factor
LKKDARSPMFGLIGGDVREDPAPLRDVLADECRRTLINEAVMLLPPACRQVLILRFGLDGEGERRLHDVGEAIGLCKERARQLEAEGLDLLAGMLEGLL